MHGIIDSTLREGEQQARLYFSTQQKIRIVDLLREAGIEEIEIGITSADNDLGVVIEAVREHSPRPRIAIWCRFREDDIALASSFCPDILSIALPVSDLHLKTRLGRDHAWAVQQIEKMVYLSQKAGVQHVSLGLEDCTRASTSFIDDIVAEAIASGVERIRICDTLGIASPTQIAALVKRYVGRGVDLAVHTHDDFGMATANAIAAFESGASWADTSILGVGERAGIAKTEVVAGFLSLQHSQTAYNLLKLKSAMEVVSTASKEPLSRRHPVFGSALFECETGLHLDGLAKNSATYEPFAPEAVGSKRSRLMGMKTGRNAVIFAAAQQSIQLDQTTVAATCTTVRSKSRRLGRPLTEEEFVNLIPTYLTSPQSG